MAPVAPAVAAVLLVSSAAALAPPRSVFVAGLGYCGLRTARTFHDTFPECSVSGCVRSVEKAAALREALPWLDAHVLDLDGDYGGLDAAGAAALRASTHVVQTIAPIADGDRDPLLALHGDDVAPGAWIAYLSSTGVYGDHGGAPVDETAATLCADAKSRARLPAERAWLDRGASVFRLGGIYGPGRSLLDAGRRRPPPSAKPVNRVFVDDIAGLLAAAAKADLRSTVVNAVDDDPAPRSEVAAFADALVGRVVAPPPGAEPGTAAPARRAAGSKRCANGRLRAFYDLRAPTYREGLALIRDAAG